jgi:hypothetical protein
MSSRKKDAVDDLERIGLDACLAGLSFVLRSPQVLATNLSLSSVAKIKKVLA